ncbi:MAG: hypothetical protein M3024_13375 [Candidatus Dormibacteraeota bacterium]|nr:hypothetical protein [Candidatus Dormibacteraeota bacterium]
MSSQLRRWQPQEIVILIVGITTPILILAVNASAFVMLHLAQFRVGIAACALVSGLCLNGLGAYTALDRARAYARHLFAEYRVWIVAAAVVVVLAWSALGAWGTYWSMADPRRLPSLGAVLTAVWLLLLPFALTFVSRRLNLRLGSGATPRDTSHAGLRETSKGARLDARRTASNEPSSPTPTSKAVNRP